MIVGTLSSLVYILVFERTTQVFYVILFHDEGIIAYFGSIVKGAGIFAVCSIKKPKKAIFSQKVCID